MSVHVYLVPGFFGFRQLGALSYFQRVVEILEENLKAHGLQDVRIIEVETEPTGSIRRRASRLLECIVEHDGHKQDHIHFVGHSAGGLDIRLLLSKNVRLSDSALEQVIASKTRSAITLASPHYGTPLANAVVNLQGRNLTYLLTSRANTAVARWGLYAVAKLLSQFARLDGWLGSDHKALDILSERVFKHITPHEGHAIYKFIDSISSDQGVMLQLTPEAVDVFNASVVDREQIDWVCFVTAGPPPKIPKSINLYTNLFALFYLALYTVTSRSHRQYPYPSLPYQLESDVTSLLPFALTSDTNDGVVPTLSQFWGRLGGVYVADHLDVIGHFPHEQQGLRYAGWLHSGAGFDDTSFRRLWNDIAGVIFQANQRAVEDNAESPSSL